jgi:sulfonate transport system ATP-binding protein
VVQIQQDVVADISLGTADPDAGAGATSEAPAPVPAARLRGVRRSFGQHVVLDGLDLRVAAGEFVAVLGRSGCGKSTLLRILGGLDREATGEISVTEPRATVFQEHRLLPWKRVAANVGLGLPREQAHQVVDEVLVEVGLDDRARAWPKTLSGGEAQRVALARALVREPALLLLDEPFGALDALTRIRMHALLAALCQRHAPAVVLVTHDVDEAIALADRVLVLADGRFAASHRVDIPGSRRRSDPRVAGLRQTLLAALGVDDEITENPRGDLAPAPSSGSAGTGIADELVPAPGPGPAGGHVAVSVAVATDRGESSL